MEEEKSAIHTEYEQERIAYQKLLKEYNMLEAANDDLKEKVNKLRGGNIIENSHQQYLTTFSLDKHDRTISNVSMSSSMMIDEDFASLESAYGGSSAGTSVTGNDLF